MAIALTFSRANCGVEAPLISVETHLSNGLPALPSSAFLKRRSKKVATEFAVLLSIHTSLFQPDG